MITPFKKAGAPVNNEAPIEFKGKAEDLLFFAYGANMRPKQIEARCHKPVVLGLARLPEHRVAFFGQSTIWDGGEETVVPEPGQEVWGVLYKLSFADREQLDSWQDVRLDGTGPYFHYPAKVIDERGETRTILLYKKESEGLPRRPSQEYLEFIVQGAQERGLPAEYVERLRRIKAKPASYPVPRYGKGARLLPLASGCTDCGDLRASQGGPGLKPLKG